MPASGRVEHRVIRHVKPSSVARVTFGFSLTLCAIGLVGWFALFVLGSVSGAIDSLLDLVWPGLTASDIPVVRIVPVLVFGSIVSSAVLAAVAAALAVVYNALSDLFGGIEVTHRSR